MYLVWCSILDWWRVRVHHDPFDLAQLRRYPEWDSELGNHDCILRFLFHILAVIAACDMVPCVQNSSFIHCQIVYCPRRRRSLYGLGHRQGRRNWSHRSSRFDHFRQYKGVGGYCRYYGLHFQLCHFDCQ